MNKLSIIIPFYKVEQHFFLECLSSLHMQTYPICEFLLVSDGAEDFLCNDVLRIAREDSRFKLLKKNHSGVSSTRNFGLENATGNYITFVDADDWIEADYAEKLIELAPNADVVFFQFLYHDSKKIYSLPYPLENFESENKDSVQEILANLLNYNNEFDYFGYTCNKVFKKEIIDKFKIEFPINISFHEDEIFALRYCRNVSSIFISTQQLYHYRQLSNGLTKKRKHISVYYDISSLILKEAPHYSNRHFIETLINKRGLFWLFMSLIRKNVIISIDEFSNFYKQYAYYSSNYQINCLTLKIIFSQPKTIAYIFCYCYRMISWLPGLGIRQ